MPNLSKVIINAKQTNSDWRQELFALLRSYRSTPHTSTGVSPSELLFGVNRTNRLPSFDFKVNSNYSDMVHLARFNDKVAKYKSKLYTDKKRGASQHSFRVGDIVLIKQRKLRKTMSRFRDKCLKVTAVKGSMISFEENGKTTFYLFKL